MDFTNKPYEKLTVTPVGVTAENNMLAASSGDVCKINPVNVTVEEYTIDNYKTTFDLSID